MPPVPTSISDVTSGGSLAQGTAYYLAVLAGNAYGTTLPSPIGTVTTAASGGSVHAVKGTVAALSGTPQPTFWDIFLHTSSTAPLWVGRMTEAQRANANGVVVTAVGTVGAGSALGAGVVQVNVIGTGLAYTAPQLLASNAYTPDAVATVGVISGSGFSRLHIGVRYTKTGQQVAPALSIVPFIRSSYDASWGQCQLLSVNLAAGVGTANQQDFELDNDGKDVVIVVDTIAGNGAAVTILADPVS